MHDSNLLVLIYIQINILNDYVTFYLQFVYIDAMVVVIILMIHPIEYMFQSKHMI